MLGWGGEVAKGIATSCRAFLQPSLSPSPASPRLWEESGSIYGSEAHHAKVPWEFRLTAFSLQNILTLRTRG